MQKNRELTRHEQQAAARVGKALAERPGFEAMSEDDIYETLYWAGEALGLDKNGFSSFHLAVYKNILQHKPDYAGRLTPEFKKRLQAASADWFL